ncbi:MAG TPA: VCBS repeat-containing protein [Acidobacteriaceae bacterium]|nr:VCBS repeat-containing protein [Acidobacteriaceae bacterium]
MKDLCQSVRTAACARLILLGILLLSGSAWAQASWNNFHNPTPYIDQVYPTAARQGSFGFLLTVRGAGFRPGAEVGWQLGETQLRLPAFVVSSAELATWIPVPLTSRATTATVTVINPNGRSLVGASNPVLLPITRPTHTVAFKQNTLALGLVPLAFVTGDFNRDGKLDLAIAEPCGTNPNCASPPASANIAILLGKGDGTFTTAPPIAIGGFPNAFAVGDFNGDGNPDLAVVQANAGTVSILLGDGHGRFTAEPSLLDTGTYVNSIVAGDVNQDGKLDLVVSNGNTGTVAIWLGKGDGTFTPGSSIPITNIPEGLSLGDLNGDGKLDLVVTTEYEPQVSHIAILLGDGKGDFTQIASPSAPFEPFVGLGDVNGDGKPDLVVSYSPGLPDLQDTVSVLLGQGNGLFGTGITSPAVVGQIGGGLLGDFNGDGKLDLAIEIGYPTNSYDFVLGDGKGTFNLADSVVVGNQSGPAVVGDFNGDGRLDLAVFGGQNGGTVTVLLQQPAP